MKNINKVLSALEFAQICWVVPDIRATMAFFEKSMGLSNFPEPYKVTAEDLEMRYRGKVEAGSWLTTQTYNGSSFIELVQPQSGDSMFHEYLAKYPNGGIQHIAFRLPVADLEKVTTNLVDQGYKIVSEVDHLIARMVFFDTYQTLGVVTEIMGVTPDGWSAIKQMENAQLNHKLDLH